MAINLEKMAAQLAKMPTAASEGGCGVMVGRDKKKKLDLISSLRGLIRGREICKSNLGSY